MDNLKNIFPVFFRKQIKYFLEKIFTPKIENNIINQTLLKKLSQDCSFKSDIIIFSVINWSFRFQRPQQIASELAKKGYRIFYIQNEFLISPSNKFPIKVDQVLENIFVINLSSTSNYFIYQKPPSFQDISHISNSLKNLFSLANIKQPSFIIDHPFWTNITQSFAYNSIYDCMDYHQGFPDTSKQILDLEKKLIQKSTEVVVSSSFLKNNVTKIRNKDIYLINNAGNYQDFKRVYPTHKNKVPVIGYFGALETCWLDTELIEIIAQSRKYNLVFAGKNNDSSLYKLANKYTNIKLLGEIPYKQLPKLLATFDICLIPFKLNDLIKAADPVKIYEYFSSGKPVLSTNLPELKKYGNLVYICNKENVLEQINLALLDSPVKRKLRQEISKSNSWKKRADDFENIINKYLIK